MSFQSNITEATVTYTT